MAGQHIYSSSLFIQSGATAEFKNDVFVDETLTANIIQASSYLDLAGNPYSTGGGGSTAVFFAGSGSGVSESSPVSRDTFITVTATNQIDDPDTPNSKILIEGIVKIETTGSSTFKPTYFNFIKVGDVNDNLITVQQGGLDQSTYIPTSNAERRSGTHRYIIFAAETGSGGETERVFHTVTIGGFLNSAPVLAPTDDELDGRFTHDTNTLTIRVNHTSSTDDNILEFTENLTADDYLDIIDFQLTNNEDTDLTFGLNNSNLVGRVTDGAGELISTNTSFIYSSSDGGADSPGGILQENLFLDVTATGTPNENQNVTIDSTLKDRYPNDPNVPGIINHQTTLTFKSAFNAQIEDVQIIKDPTNEYNMSYGDNQISLNLNLIANINSDNCKDASNNKLTNHFTTIKIYNSSQTTINSDSFIKTFKFNIDETTASSQSSDDNFDGSFTPITTSYISHGFTLSNDNFTDSTSSFYLGNINNSVDTLEGIKHGTHNHFEHERNLSPTEFEIYKAPPIEVNNISVEIERDLFTNKGFTTDTRELLSGLPNTLESNQTQSSIIDVFDGTIEARNNYISQSIVRVRLTADVVEPFSSTEYEGTITATIQDKANTLSPITYPMNRNSVGASVEAKGFHHSQQPDKNVLKVKYVSPFFEVPNIPEGTHQFDVTFEEDTSTPLSVGFTFAESSSATLNVTPAPSQTISNISLEVESGSFKTNVGHTSLTSSILYGLTSSLTSNQTSSLIEETIHDFVNHPHYNGYISQSIVRLRLKSKITQPFLFGSNPDKYITASFSIPDQITDTVGETIEIVKDGSTNPGILMAPNNNSINTFIDLTEDFTYAGVTQITIKQIQVRGGLNDGGIENLTIGNIPMPNSTLANGSDLGSISSNGFDWTFQTNINDPGFLEPNLLVNIINGQVPISFDVSNEVNSDLVSGADGQFYEIKITFEATPVVPPGSFNSPEFIFSNDDEISSDFYETAPSEIGTNIVGNYTSSWVEFNFPKGIYTFTPKFISGSTAPNSILDTSNQQISVISMSATPPVEIINRVTEIETQGHSNEGTDESTRTVLYGVNSATNSDSSSYASHPSASAFAAQSVSRFRTQAKIIEPFGVGQSTSIFELLARKINTSLAIDQIISIIQISTTDTNSITENQDNISHSISTYNDKKLETVFTSSWLGTSLPAELGPDNATIYQGFTTINSIVNSNTDLESILTDSSSGQTQSTLNVFDTPPTEISHLVHAETHGYSGEITTTTTRSVLYGDDQITNDTSESKVWENHINSIPYASASVTRFKRFIKVTEPLGPLHASSTITPTYNDSPNSSENIIFNTESQYLVTRIHDDDERMVVEYEVPFISGGKGLESTLREGQTYLVTNNIHHSPSGENGHIIVDKISSSILVKDTPKVQFDFPSESTKGETLGGSEIDFNSQDFSKNFQTINDNTTTAANLTEVGDLYTGSRVTRFKIQPTIIEPLGYAHNSTTGNVRAYEQGTADYLYTSEIFFNTESNNISWGYNQYYQRTASYSSSFNGIALTTSSNWIVDGQITSIDNLTSGDFEEIGTFNDDFTTLTVIEGGTSTINTFKVEIETFSGSLTTVDPSVGRTTHILHGQADNRSFVSSTLNNTLPNEESKQQMVRARVLASITGPVETESPIKVEIFHDVYFQEGLKIPLFLILSGSGNKLNNGVASDIYSDFTEGDNVNGILDLNGKSLGTNNPVIVGADQTNHFTSSFFPIIVDASHSIDGPELKTVAFSASITELGGKVLPDGINDIFHADPINIHVTGALSASINISTKLSGSEYIDGNPTDGYTYLFDETDWEGLVPEDSTNNFLVTNGLNIENNWGFVEVGSTWDGNNQSIANSFYNTPPGPYSSKTLSPHQFGNAETEGGKGVILRSARERFIGPSQAIRVIHRIFHNFKGLGLPNGSAEKQFNYNHYMVADQIASTYKTTNDGYKFGFEYRVNVNGDNGLGVVFHRINIIVPSQISKSEIITRRNGLRVYASNTEKNPENPGMTLVGEIAPLSHPSTITFKSSDISGHNNGNIENVRDAFYNETGKWIQQEDVSWNSIKHRAICPRYCAIYQLELTTDQPYKYYSVVLGNDTHSGPGSAGVGKYTFNSIEFFERTPVSKPITFFPSASIDQPTYRTSDDHPIDFTLDFNDPNNEITLDSNTSDTASFKLLKSTAENEQSITSFELIVTASEADHVEYIEKKITPFSIISDNLNGILDNGNFLTTPTLHTRSLASGSFENYKSGDAPTDNTTIKTSTRVFFTGNGALDKFGGKRLPLEGNNYSMSFSTPNDYGVIYDGTDTGTINKAFGFGDKGSLEVKVNGITKVNLNLEDNFNSSDVASDQILTSRSDNGTGSFNDSNGRLILNNIRSYNNIQDAVTLFGVTQEHGLQSFDCTIQLDNKFQDGYNTLDLIHNIAPEVTHSLNTFDWYYDDGHDEFGRKIDGNSYQNNDSSQQDFIEMDERDSANHFLSWSWADGYNDDSLINISGIQYVKEGAAILVHVTGSEADKLIGVQGLSNKTINPIIAVTRATTTESITHISTESIQSPISHSLANLNGFEWIGNSGNPIPPSSSLGRISNILISASNVGGPVLDDLAVAGGNFVDSDKSSGYSGKVADLGTAIPNLSDFTIDSKDQNGTFYMIYKGCPVGASFTFQGQDDETFVIDYPIANYVDTSSIAGYNTGSNSTEDFHTEHYRWSSASFADDTMIEASRDNYYTYFLGQSNCNFDSLNFDPNRDIQQHIMGVLVPCSHDINESVKPELNTNYQSKNKDGNDLNFIIDSTQLGGPNTSNGGYDNQYLPLLHNTHSFIAQNWRNNPTKPNTYCRAFIVPSDGFEGGKPFYNEEIFSFKVKIKFLGRETNMFTINDNPHIVDNPIDQTTSYNVGNELQYEGRSFKVEIRLPGPVDSNDNSNNSAPGTKWGILSGEGNGTAGLGQTSNNWNAGGNHTFNFGANLFDSPLITDDFNVSAHQTDDLKIPFLNKYDVSNVVPYVTNFEYLNKSYGNITSSMKAETNTYPIVGASVGFNINKEFTSNNYDYYYNEVTYNVQLAQSSVAQSDGVFLLRISELKKGGNGSQNDLSFPNFISSIEVTRS